MATVFCIGRNYADHAIEMGAAPVASGEPIVFLKPLQAVVSQPPLVTWPQGVGRVQYEAELVLRLGPGGRPQAIALGLDLTDRTLQARAKTAGLPWTASKGFRGSAPVGPFVLVSAVPPLDRVRFTLRINGEVRQEGDTRNLLWPVTSLLAHLDRWYGLKPGDLVFTGTPAGVGDLSQGDVLELSLEDVPAAFVRFHVGGPG